MREAVVVSYARTGLAKSARGGFNMTPAMIDGRPRHRARRRPSRASSPDAVEDVYLGNGAHGAGNLARLSGLLAGLPVTTAGATIQRHCSSGLNAIALAANYIKEDGADVVVAGGVESISMPNPGFGGPANMDPKLEEQYPAIYMAMIETADIVAERYGVSREYQDEYSLQSQQRMAAAQEHGLFADEIVPMATKMKLVDNETKEETHRRLRRRPRRVQPARHHARGPGQAAAGARRGQLHHRRQRQPAVRRRRRRGADGGGRGRAPRPEAAGRVPGLGRRRLRARRDGHRPGLRRAPPAQAPRPHRRRHRPVGAQRGVRQPVPVLPRPPRHRPREVQRQRRLDRRRPPVRHDRRPLRRPHPPGGSAPRRQVGRRHDVHRRRPGRRRAVRDLSDQI